MSIILSRFWAMPSHLTFEIKPIKELLSNRINLDMDLWLDPFAKDSKLASMTNDINPKTTADFHLDALQWLRNFRADSIDGVLFDPPYSLRQLKECYDGIGSAMTAHQSKHFFSDLKNEIARIVRPGGCVISFGWSSGGIGKNRGFEIEEVMLIAHGGNHNDTIVTIDIKGGVCCGL